MQYANYLNQRFHYFYFQQVAWSVSTNTLDFNLTKSRQLVAFENIAVNAGNLWKRRSNCVLIPISGTYYVHLEVGTCYKTRNAMKVVVNKVTTIVYVQFTGKFLVSSQSRSQGNVLHLAKGDKVAVYLTSGCYHGGKNQTSFYGMLLAPAV